MPILACGLKIINRFLIRRVKAAGRESTWGELVLEKKRPRFFDIYFNVVVCANLIKIYFVGANCKKFVNVEC